MNKPIPPQTAAGKSPKLSLLVAALLGVFFTITGCRAADAPPAGTASTSAPDAKRTAPFILGADITFLLEDEAAGAEYYDHGVKKDFFQILKDNKFNYVRVPSVVEPTSFFSRGDLEHVKLLAKRAKAANLGLLVDFFYSDTWASPEGQPKPAAWTNLTFPDMVTALHDHTKAVLTALKEQGTTPDLVQIGNEITFGMVWPDGRITSKTSTGNPTTDAHNAGVTNAGGWGNFALLLKAGISATKEVDPNIKIMLHHSLARNDALVHEWITNLIGQGVTFDLVGFSCYTEHAANDWKTTFDDIATNFPQFGIIAVEYSNQKRYVNDLVFNAPNNQGLGSFIWSPMREREAIFDHLVSTNAPANNGGRYDANAFMLLYPQMAQAYGNP
jgi:arabinogalactan endo-1,4-beta-galactosidase